MGEGAGVKEEDDGPFDKVKFSEDVTERKPLTLYTAKLFQRSTRATREALGESFTLPMDVSLLPTTREEVCFSPVLNAPKQLLEGGRETRVSVFLLATHRCSPTIRAFDRVLGPGGTRIICRRPRRPTTGQVLVGRLGIVGQFGDGRGEALPRGLGRSGTDLRVTTRSPRRISRSRCCRAPQPPLVVDMDLGVAGN
ncbi:hypothetical protein DL768_003120 [Monosporascus sp. mg162]|nr:hypothetical protein DL768_003120 [Monosporascus sp. mg162]